MSGRLLFVEGFAIIRVQSFLVLILEQLPFLKFLADTVLTRDASDVLVLVKVFPHVGPEVSRGVHMSNVSSISSTAHCTVTHLLVRVPVT